MISPSALRERLRFWKRLHQIGVLFFLFAGSPSAFPQGALTPPGAPAPLFKTLQEVEPRTNLQATPAPAGVDTTNPSYHFIINQPGSYYLSSNLSVTKGNGILINTEGVTLDLNGFQISPASGTGGNGIEVAPTAHRATVRNGSVKAFAYGLRADIGLTEAHGGLYRDLTASDCTTVGLYAGLSSVVESCRANDNSGIGILADENSILSKCSASNNSNNGIQTTFGCVLTSCSARANTGHGMSIASSSSVTNCVAYQNSGDGFLTNLMVVFIGCTSQGNSKHGFEVGNDCTVSKCVAAENGFDGIRVASQCLVIDNNCTANGQAGQFAGIFLNGGSDRVEGNYTAQQAAGISAVTNSTGHFVVRNYSTFNAANYSLPASNVFVGTIVGTNAAMNSATNSLVNISFNQTAQQSASSLKAPGR